MTTEAGDPQEAGSRTDPSSEFDPASWLAWAERCGYRIYLSGAAKKRPFRIVTEAPQGPKAAEDVALWHAFQGSPKQSKVNRAVLIAYLVRTGRFGLEPQASDSTRLTARRHPCRSWSSRSR
jgi:hypothetical protein